MKLEDLGYDVRTGYHDHRLTPLESRFVGILWGDHEGRDNCIGADVFAVRLMLRTKDKDARRMIRVGGENFARDLAGWKRDLRRIHNHILQHHSNIPVLSKAGFGGGYWVAETEAEAEEFYATFRKRGLTGLVKASRGKQAALVDMVQQLSFEFEELADKSGFTGPVRPRAAMPTPIEVVDSFLERMTGNPEKFADGLRKIGEKYGSVLLPKEQVSAMKMKAAELQEMVNALG